MKKYYYVLFVVIVILMLLGIFLLVNKKQDSEKTKSESIINSSEEENFINEENSNTDNSNSVIEVPTTELEDMKNSIIATGNTEIYQVEQERDGRKYLQIKPQVQFYVDLAGIIKQTKPDENELEKLVAQVPTDYGIWISTQSREKFLKLLNKNGITDFTITDNGYLKNNGTTKNNIENQLEKMIHSNKLYIINITGVAYQRDYISGKIVTYPFEEMDPEQVLESYTDENKIILELSTNEKQKLTDKEILETIIKY